jgi:hypothetical protein
MARDQENNLNSNLNSQKIQTLKQFHKRIMKERFINNQASVYYSSQNSKFVIPGIMITGISSVASFMATSDIAGDTLKTVFSIGVGILTAGATILQSISSSFGFQSRADNFQRAADLYDTLLTKIEFEICNPNEDFNEFCNSLEASILDIKNDCKYLPPLFINTLWEKHKEDYLSEFEKISLNFELNNQNIVNPVTIEKSVNNNLITIVDIPDMEN